MSNMIKFHAPNDTMGDTPADQCQLFRDWAKAQIETRFPGCEVEVSDEPSTAPVWVKGVSLEEATSFCGQLWDECDWPLLRTYQDHAGTIKPMWQWEQDYQTWPEHKRVQMIESLLEVVNIGGHWVDLSIDDDLLYHCVTAVECNNAQIRGAWTDWNDAFDILEVYGDGKDDKWVRLILDRAIESDGDTLAQDLGRVCDVVWGEDYPSSFWRR